MKKIIVVLILFCVFATIIRVMPENVAYAKEEGGQAVDSGVDKELDKLDTSDLQSYIDSLTAEESTLSGDDVKALIRSLAKGESDLDFSNIVDSALNYAAKSLLGFIPSIISIVIISILYGMLSNLNGGFLDKSTNQIVYFACYGASVIILLSEIISMVNVTVTASERVQTLMFAVFPVLLTLMTALGGVVGVGLYKPLMTVAATYTVAFIKSFVLPCFSASVVLTVVGNLSPTVKLNKLSAFFKKLAEWSLGLIFGVFLTVLTAKGVVGRTADGVAVNAAKFALGSYVPILGGYIADGFDVVMASCMLIKNAVGVTGLLLLVSVLLAPTVKIVVFTLVLKFAAALAEPVSDGKISEMLSGISKSAGLLLAVLFGMAFMFFSMIMLVVTSCNLGVV